MILFSGDLHFLVQWEKECVPFLLPAVRAQTKKFQRMSCNLKTFSPGNFLLDNIQILLQVHILRAFALHAYHMMMMLSHNFVSFFLVSKFHLLGNVSPL